MSKAILKLNKEHIFHKKQDIEIDIFEYYILRLVYGQKEKRRKLIKC